MPRQADAEGCPAYLESSALVNNAYYEKFGFEHKMDVSFERGSAPVKLSVMIREPQPVRKLAYANAVAKFHSNSNSNSNGNNSNSNNRKI